MEVMEYCTLRGTLPKRCNLPGLTRTLSRDKIAYTGKQKYANDAGLTLKYTRLRNQVTAKLRQAKQSYFSKVIPGG